MPDIEIIKYDARLERCPIPLIKTKLLLKSLDKGQALRILLCDSSSKQDIPKWMTTIGLKFTTIELSENDLEITVTKEK